MSLTREDFADIKNELDDRYVLQSDCNDKQDIPPIHRKIEYITNKSDRVICRSFLLKIYRKLLKKFCKTY